MIVSFNNYIDSRKQVLGGLVSSYVLKKPTAMYEIKEQNLDFLIDNLNKEEIEFVFELTNSFIKILIK